MLVLSRKDGQSILIGDNVRVTVIGHRHGKTQLGIDAPNEVQIVREELNESDEKGNDSAHI